MTQHTQKMESEVAEQILMRLSAFIYSDPALGKKFGTDVTDCTLRDIGGGRIVLEMPKRLDDPQKEEWATALYDAVKNKLGGFKEQETAFHPLRNHMGRLIFVDLAYLTTVANAVATDGFEPLSAPQPANAAER